MDILNHKLYVALYTMIETALIIIIVICLIAHAIYWVHLQNNPKYKPETEYFIGKRHKQNVLDRKENLNKEGFWGERSGRDTHEGSYYDFNNEKGSLGNEEPTGDFMNKADALRAIEKVFNATNSLESTTEPGEYRSGDQIFMFHDELEGVRASISKRNTKRVWTPSEFLNLMETDGYKSDDAESNTWNNSLMIYGNQ